MIMLQPEDIARQNEALKETSRLLFGDSAELRIVDPASLVLLKENARYFKKETFKQLVANLRQDQRLSSVPLCYPMENSRLEVLSGNHRVKASMEAGIKWIMVIVILEEIELSRKISIQLSHNSLVGEDDQQILAGLWARIEDIKAKCYAGLSSETIGELQNIKLLSFSTPQPRTRQVAFAFTEPEFEAVEAIMQELGRLPADRVYLIQADQFDEFFKKLLAIKKTDNIKNGSLAMLRLLEKLKEVA
jgi:hypothetical protein